MQKFDLTLITDGNAQNPLIWSKTPYSLWNSFINLGEEVSNLNSKKINILPLKITSKILTIIGFVHGMRKPILYPIYCYLFQKLIQTSHSSHNLLFISNHYLNNNCNKNYNYYVYIDAV